MYVISKLDPLNLSDSKSFELISFAICMSYFGSVVLKLSGIGLKWYSILNFLLFG